MTTPTDAASAIIAQSDAKVQAQVNDIKDGTGNYLRKKSQFSSNGAINSAAYKKRKDTVLRLDGEISQPEYKQMYEGLPGNGLSTDKNYLNAKNTYGTDIENGDIGYGGELVVGNVKDVNAIGSAQLLHGKTAAVTTKTVPADTVTTVGTGEVLPDKTVVVATTETKKDVVVAGSTTDGGDTVRKPDEAVAVTPTVAKEVKDVPIVKPKIVIKTNVPILTPLGKALKIGLGKLGANDAVTAMLSSYNKFKVGLDVYNGYRKVYIFLTAPSCNLRADTSTSSNATTWGVSKELLTGDVFLASYIADNIRNMQLSASLSYHSGLANSVKSPWMFPLMNMLVGTSNMPNFEFKTKQGPANTMGHVMETPFAMATQGNQLTLTFQDDRNALVARLLYMWTHYIHAVNKGNVTPRLEYIKNGALDYTTSMYILVSDETGSKLDYWFKAVGMYPKGRNYDYLDLSRAIVQGGDGGSISVPFYVDHFEDMHQNIIDDFNTLSYLYDGVTYKTDLVDKQRDKSILAGLGDWYHDKFFIIKTAVGGGSTGMGDYHLMSFASDDFTTTSTAMVKGYMDEARQTIPK